MATTINAGRVRFISRGTYNNSTQYYLFDLVDYNGSSYIAKENTVGNLPTNTQYWQLIAEKGNTGSTGQTGPTGATGNGIASITKTGTSGLVDTYTITYTNGNTTTFTVTNGEDGEVTQTQFDDLQQRVEDAENNQLTYTPTPATSHYLQDSADSRFRKFIPIGRTTQDGNPTPENPVPIKNTGDNGSVNEKVSNSDGTQEQNLSFPLAEGQKFYEGSHPDDDEKVHHKWGEMVLPAINSLTSGTVFGVSCKFGAINIPTMKSQSSVSGNFFCDKVKYANGVWGKYQGYVIAKNFVVLTDLEDTVENFNSKISGATLQFPLEQEQTEDFTEEQKTAWKEWKKARTYKNVTHISSEDETLANLEVEYVRDLETVINNLSN